MTDLRCVVRSITKSKKTQTTDEKTPDRTDTGYNPAIKHPYQHDKFIVNLSVVGYLGMPSLACQLTERMKLTQVIAYFITHGELDSLFIETKAKKIIRIPRYSKTREIIIKLNNELEYRAPKPRQKYMRCTWNRLLSSSLRHYVCGIVPPTNRERRKTKHPSSDTLIFMFNRPKNLVYVVGAPITKANATLINTRPSITKITFETFARCFIEYDMLSLCFNQNIYQRIKNPLELPLICALYRKGVACSPSVIPSANLPITAQLTTTTNLPTDMIHEDPSASSITHAIQSSMRTLSNAVQSVYTSITRNPTTADDFALGRARLNIAEFFQLVKKNNFEIHIWKIILTYLFKPGHPNQKQITESDEFD